MHPAFSVIFFTTASGAGYGLLTVAGVLAVLGLLPQNVWFALACSFTALALITAGLLSSTFHLGHPERAWRAFSQWRTSWLSREGVLALITYIPALGFAVAWAFPQTHVPLAALGALVAVFSMLTVFTTAMIYRSLKPIHAWHNKWVVPCYIVLSLMTGSVILLALSAGLGVTVKFLAAACGVLLAAGLTVKWLYWSFIDETAGPATPASATGLAATGPDVQVRSVEWPHTEANYVMKEMGFAIARKHAGRLRNIAIWLGFLVPAVLIETTILLPQLFSGLLAVPAAMVMAAGVVVERWLFFAEAKHAVTLYYGAQKA
ncbi:MAG: dimethyl sulfoxide reductase anchor subunit [Rhodospirillaceae bacterium]|nr:dimethyl sulfoxide reductase anchor subunit [Rhodospirillaceae bacterium]